jgi:glycerol-3-phosphate acyltransferase PlsY
MSVFFLDLHVLVARYGVLLLIIVAVAAYLMGNLNPSIIIGMRKGVDIRSAGSGNAGTTNTLRVMGKKTAAVVFLIDVLKGFITVFLVTRYMSFSFGLICGVLVVVGHMFPAIFGFKGGKGVATAFGVILAVQWVLALILIAIVFLCVAIWRRVSLGTVVACICAVPLALILTGSAVDAVFVAIIILLILLKHIPNIIRLINGTESKISLKKSSISK